MSQNIRTIITAILFIGSIAVIAVTLVLVVKEKKRAHEIQDEISILQEEKKRFEHENSELSDHIAYLKSDHSYEKAAKNLNYKNPGEHVTIIRRSQEDVQSSISEGSPENAPKQTKKHYNVWFDYFF